MHNPPWFSSTWSLQPFVRPRARLTGGGFVAKVSHRPTTIGGNPNNCRFFSGVWVTGPYLVFWLRSCKYNGAWGTALVCLIVRGLGCYRWPRENYGKCPPKEFQNGGMDFFSLWKGWSIRLYVPWECCEIDYSLPTFYYSCLYTSAS